MNKPKILVLCTSNSARSQMAEALFRKYGGDHYEVHSAGIEPKGINPYTVRVMEEVGVDMSGHSSKDVREYLGKGHFAYVFTVCNHAEQNCPRAFLTMGTHEHWDLEDPAAQQGDDAEKLAKFRQVRDQIDGLVRAWLAGRNVA